MKCCRQAPIYPRRWQQVVHRSHPGKINNSIDDENISVPNQVTLKLIVASFLQFQIIFDWKFYKYEMVPDFQKPCLKLTKWSIWKWRCMKYWYSLCFFQENHHCRQCSRISKLQLHTNKANQTHNNFSTDHVRNIWKLFCCLMSKSS